jgi:O-antigen ligase
MTAKMTTMSQRDLEYAASRGGVGAPRLAQIADGLATAVAVSLPWSTSATAILIVLWLMALVPTLDAAAVRREVMSAAGGLPVLLWALGAVGMLWADVSWSERIAGLSGFHKLLLVPLLLAQFRRGGHAKWVILGFLASCVVLLVVSWALFLPSGLTWSSKERGVPVKNYIIQSEIFAICAFGLIGQAIELWPTRQRQFAIVLLFVAVIFVANVGYVATSRTTLVVMAVLILLFGLRQFGWKGALAAAAIGSVLAGIVWVSSPYLRERVSQAVKDVETYDASNINTSPGLRFEYWKKSLAFVAEAPLIGHGTGSIPKLFRNAATAETIPPAITTNPHSQILAVAVPLGLVGTVVLIALWIAHLVLFRDGTLVAWLGLVVVTDNIVSSLFNSHLFDFSQGWLYVFGVGVIGGMVLRGAPPTARAQGKIEGKIEGKI